MKIIATCWMILCGAGCDDVTFVIDPFPIDVSLASGAPELFSGPLGQAPIGTLVDTGAPLTVLDLEAPEPARARIDLMIHDASAIPRALFLSAQILDAAVVGTGPGSGDPSAPLFATRAVLGGDLLQQIAVRFDLPHQELHFFPDIAGSDEDYAQSCDAVLRTPLLGAGSVRVGSDAVPLLGTRVVLDACFAQTPFANDTAPDEKNAVLVLATGMSATVLTRSAFLRLFGPLDPPIIIPDDEITTPWFFPGSQVPTLVKVIDLNAYVAAPTPNDPRHFTFSLVHILDGTRSACREVWANYAMGFGCPPSSCTACDDATGQGTDPSCAAGAVIRIDDEWVAQNGESAALAFLVIRDDDPLIQSVRTQVGPRTATIDGFLGANALGAFVADVDYPHARVIARCSDAPPPGVTCTTYPRVPGSDHGLCDCFPGTTTVCP